jgi:hypothetical protein
MGRLSKVAILAQLSAVGASSVCNARTGRCGRSTEDDASSLLQRHLLHTQVDGQPSDHAYWFTTTSTPAPGSAVVDELYTYGAPATAVPQLTDHAHGGTFPGVRAYTEDVFGPANASLDFAAVYNNLYHAQTATLVLNHGAPSSFVPGGRPEMPVIDPAVKSDWALHMFDVYKKRLHAVTLADGEDPSQHPEIGRSAFFMGLATVAYLPTFMARTVLLGEYPGWRLVADEVLVSGLQDNRDTDPVRLYQHKNLECALVFTGTNALCETAASADTLLASYCGFNGVHHGYAQELRRITSHLLPYLSPKLSQCSKVSVIGHSLGGAVAEVFAACANSGHADDADYKQQAWVKGTPTRMPATSGGSHEVRVDEVLCLR